MGNENNGQRIENDEYAVAIAKKHKDLIKSNVITKRELEAYETVHTKVESMIQSIPPKYKDTKNTQKAMVVKRLNLTKVAPSVAKQLCDVVGFLPYKMRSDFSKQVTNIFEQLQYSDQEATKWFDAKLSGDWGGKTHIVAALLMGNAINDNTVSVGIALMAEEWQEEEHVKLLVNNWNREDLQKYALYILYKKLSKAIEN